MDMEYEGIEQYEANDIKMMALHVSSVPDYTWGLPGGLDYYWSKPHLPRKSDLWKNAEIFLGDAIEAANEDFCCCRCSNEKNR
jgi:hypothetical protein